MKRITTILAPLLIFALLAGCTGPGEADDLPAEGQDLSSAGRTEEPLVSKRFRIVDGAGSGSLLLAGLDDGGADDVLYLGTDSDTLEIYLDGAEADASALEDGMAITVTWDGLIFETYPGQIPGGARVEAWSLGSEQNPGGGYYDLCGLYLQVLNDLWEKDSALNEGKGVIALDLTQAPGGLTDSEKAALAWRFGELHGVQVLQSTWEQLAEKGVLTEQTLGDGNAVYSWEDGCLFSITAHETEETEAYSLPVLRFDAEKYVGPLAAYWFGDCTAVWPELGTWTEYAVGAEMIS